MRFIAETLMSIAETLEKESIAVELGPDPEYRHGPIAELGEWGRRRGGGYVIATADLGSPREYEPVALVIGYDDAVSCSQAIATSITEDVIVVCSEDNRIVF